MQNHHIDCYILILKKREICCKSVAKNNIPVAIFVKKRKSKFRSNPTWDLPQRRLQRLTPLQSSGLWISSKTFLQEKMPFQHLLGYFIQKLLFIMHNHKFSLLRYKCCLLSSSNSQRWACSEFCLQNVIAFYFRDLLKVERREGFKKNPLLSHPVRALYRSRATSYS
jgi:hypothetical protein